MILTISDDLQSAVTDDGVRCRFLRYARRPDDTLEAYVAALSALLQPEAPHPAGAPAGRA